MDHKIANLKAILAEAKSETLKSSASGDINAYLAFHEELMLAERRLAEAEYRPYAVRTNCSLAWDTGRPIPTLLQSDHITYLMFLLRDDPDNIGLVEFNFCAASTFGSPGDETFHGHPLFGSGFEAYQAMEVINSPWIIHLRKVDSAHHRHELKHYDDYKHFIFPFHDTTFECVARSFSAPKIPGPHSEAIVTVAKRLPSDG